jgi:16S rRNA (uracil1498-N3)-methyltransferase
VFVADPGAPELSAQDAHHLARVLRLAPGEEVVAADGKGHWCRCAYRGPGRAPGRGGAVGPLEPLEPVAFEAAPPAVLTVAFAPPKGDRPAWIVQKLTELSIDRVAVIDTERGVVRWAGSRADGPLDRLRRVAREASAQCRRVWLPEVTAGLTPATLGGLDAGGGAPALAQVGGGPLAEAHRTLAVGPEGGWSPAELGLGYAEVGLGPLVLRAETAAVAAGALMAALRAGTVAAMEGRPQPSSEGDAR